MPIDDISAPQRSLTPSPFQVKFWGVRGNIPTPGQAFVRYGGNTACLEILVSGQRLIFDGGTGLKVLGEALCKEMVSTPIEAYLFFTHSHWDRIQGFPFFKPAFLPGNTLKIYGSIATNGASIKQRLMQQMTRPGFSIPLHQMQANLEFYNLSPSAQISLPETIEDDRPEGKIIVETMLLNSSDFCLGYRVTAQDRVIVYATDIEARGGKMSRGLAHLAQDADLLIYDLVHPFYGTNHNSTAEWLESPLWQATLALATEAKVKQLVLFHHDPWCDDTDLAQMETAIQSRFPWISFAKEGMTIALD
jgi:ribonuclease Z